MTFTLRMRDETRRKWRIFRQNRRGFASLVLLATLLVLSLFAELYANSRPLLVFYQGAYYFPLWRTYPETTFGGDFATEANYHDLFIRDKLTAGGNWAIYPPIRWDYKALKPRPGAAPSQPPFGRQLAGHGRPWPRRV